MTQKLDDRLAPPLGLDQWMGIIGIVALVLASGIYDGINSLRKSFETKYELNYGEMIPQGKYQIPKIER